MTETHHKVWAEISLDALRSNLDAVHDRLRKMQSKADIMAVVKADAYGHGERETVAELYRNGIKYFAVSNIDEAMSIASYCPRSDMHIRGSRGAVCAACRENDCPRGDILILGHTIEQDAPSLQESGIIQGVISANHARALSGCCSPKLPPLRCHIKLDTGMGRVGLKCADAKGYADEIRLICSLPNLRVEGLYTHFSVADSVLPENIAYTQTQMRLFSEICTLAAPLGLRHFHCMNSAAGCGFEKPFGTLMRAGIVLYGLLPDSAFPMPFEPKPVMSLKSIVAQLCEHHAGDCISYGRTFTASGDMKLAVIPIGYADGYPRLLSSKAHVLIRGKRCPIIGRICMDQLMADVTGTDIAEGDTVTLIGSDGSESVTADELAGLIGTIGYEIICGISKRVPRIYSGGIR